MKNIFKIIIIFIILIAIATSVSGFEISPENPVVGDKITLTGNTGANSEIPISINFTENMNVAPGNNKYEYQINGIEIPSGQFNVTADDVVNLNVAVKLLLWWTRSADAVAETATISQGHVPAGTYHVKMYGTAIDGVSSVPLTITASTKITADANGNYKYEISSKKLSPGNYYLTVGAETKTITLLARKEKPKEKGSSIAENIQKILIKLKFW